LRSLELQPNRENATPEELRVAMEAAPNKRSYVRLCALRALLLGQAAGRGLPNVCADRSNGAAVDRMLQSGWHRWADHPPKRSRPRKIKLQRVRDLLLPVLENPPKAGKVHWTRVKIHG
jgi:hypothetical protein